LGFAQLIRAGAQILIFLIREENQWGDLKRIKRVERNKKIKEVKI